MHKTVIAVMSVAIWAACATSHAVWSVSDKGTWPTSWPKELEPLREQARSATGGLVNQTFHEIPFADRDQFEAAWPHLLSLKTKGAPIVLRRSQHALLSPMQAGVRVFEELASSKHNKYAGKPLPGVTQLGERWLYTTYIELVVDGDVVDLNRNALPREETPIVDERFTKPADPLKGSVGKRVTLNGVAEARKLGAALRGETFHVWIDGLHDWPDALRDQSVVVTGVLEERHDLPFFIADTPEERSRVQGIPVPSGTDVSAARHRYVLRDAKWTRHTGERSAQPSPSAQR